MITLAFIQTGISPAGFAQLVTIGFKVWLILALLGQISDMKYSFWCIAINKIRYTAEVAIFSFTPYGKIPNMELNEPYEYLKEEGNKVYKWIMLCYVSQMISLFALLQDYQTNHYITKSPLWFISSPFQSLSMAMAIFYLFATQRRLINENRLLKAQMNSIRSNSY